MQIIIEYVLLNNLVINAIIILLTAKVFSEKGRLIFLSSLFGSVIALIFPLFNLHMVIELLLKAFVGCLICCLSFNFKTFKKFTLIFSVFMFVTMLLGGACYVVQNAIGNLPIFVPLSVVLLLWYVLNVLIRIFHKKRSFSSFFYVVCLKAGGICIEEKAYLDSGNTLFDPLTKLPVVVLNHSVLKKLYPNTPMEKLPGAHYVRVGTLASGSKMLIFELDRLTIVGEDKSNKTEHHHSPVMAGLSLAGFEKSFEASVLLHPELV